MFPLPFISLYLPFAGAMVLLGLRLYHRVVRVRRGVVMNVSRRPLRIFFLLMLLLNVVFTFVIWMKFRSEGSMLYVLGSGGWTRTMNEGGAVRTVMQVDALGAVSALAMSFAALVAGLRTLADRNNVLAPTKTAFFLLTMCGVQGIFYSNGLFSLALYFVIAQAGASGLYLGIPSDRGEAAQSVWYYASRAACTLLFAAGAVSLCSVYGTSNIAQLASMLKNDARTLTAFVLLATPLLFLFMKSSARVNDAGRRCFFGIRAQAAFFLLFRVVFSLYGPMPGLEKIPPLFIIFGIVMFLTAVVYSAAESDPLIFAEGMEAFMKGFMLVALGLGLSGTYSAEAAALYGYGALEAMIGLWLIFLPLSATLSIVCCRLKDRIDDREIWQVGGLASVMPFTCVVSVMMLFSMTGLPPFVGYTARQFLYRTSDSLSPLLMILLFAVSLVQLLYGVRYLAAVFFGRFAPGRNSGFDGDSAIALPLFFLLIWFSVTSLLPGSTFHSIISPTAETLMERGAAPALPHTDPGGASE